MALGWDMPLVEALWLNATKSELLIHSALVYALSLIESEIERFGARPSSLRIERTIGASPTMLQDHHPVYQFHFAGHVVEYKMNSLETPVHILRTVYTGRPSNSYSALYFSDLRVQVKTDLVAGSVLVNLYEDLLSVDSNTQTRIRPRGGAEDLFEISPVLAFGGCIAFLVVAYLSGGWRIAITREDPLPERAPSLLIGYPNDFGSGVGYLKSTWPAEPGFPASPSDPRKAHEALWEYAALLYEGRT
jgi:hypothetical protein